MEQRPDRGGHLDRQHGPIGFTLEDARKRIGDRVACKRALSRQHLEHHAPERPDIRALVHLQAARLLRAHVGRRAEDPALSGSIE